MNVDLSNINLFNELAKIAESTRTIILPRVTKGDDVQRLGHCGLCGEFIHSFAHMMTDVEFDEMEGLTEDEIKQNFQKSALKIAQENSQLSLASPSIAGSLANNEIVLYAIPRSIQDLREWMQNTDTLDSDLIAQLNTMMDRAEEIYTPIQEAIIQELKL